MRQGDFPDDEVSTLEAYHRKQTRCSNFNVANVALTDLRWFKKAAQGYHLDAKLIASGFQSTIVHDQCAWLSLFPPPELSSSERRVHILTKGAADY